MGLVEGEIFQPFADFQHIGASGREITQDAAFTLAVAIDDGVNLDHLAAFFQQGVNDGNWPS